MSGQLDSRKDSHPTKYKQKSPILLNRSFRELYDSKLSGLHNFDKMAITLSQQRDKNSKSWL